MDTKARNDADRVPLDCINPKVGSHLTAYEFGWLTDAERHRFEGHLQKCPACAHDLQSMAPVWEVLQENPEILADAPEREARPPLATGWEWLGRSWRQVAIVASMLLMVGIVYWLRPSARDSILLSHETVHLRQPARNSSLAGGLQALRLGDMPLAKIFFQKAVRESPESYEAHYLLGFVLLKESERNVASARETINYTMDHLQKAMALSERWENPIYLAQCYYYLARAYLVQKDTGHALDLLTRIEHLPAGDPDLGALKQRAADLKILCPP